MLLGVDVGGTFTDAVLVDGPLAHTGKVPSTPQEPVRGVLAAIAAVLASSGADASAVSRFAHGMTVATNAVLEGHPAPAGSRFARSIHELAEHLQGKSAVPRKSAPRFAWLSRS